jgi:hypothetical protein
MTTPAADISNPTAPAESRNHTSLARASTFEPTAPDRRRRAEEHKKQGVHPPEIADLPVAVGDEERTQKAHIGRTRDRLLYADRA